MAESGEIVTAQTAGHAYDILIGRGILQGALKRDDACSFEGIAVMVSSRVYDLHGAYIKKSLESIGRYELLILDDNEKNKSYRYAEEYLQAFLARGLNRKSAVIGIGGGVVGDFAGYCAAVYMRGIPVIHVPTTLLAMVDSSIGGKVAVNLSLGKNIVGAFHQPALVVSDVGFLSTLPEDELKNGLTEALKHGLLGDDETIGILEENDLDSITSEGVMAKLVARSALFKSGIVFRDEKEAGLRAILNFGHTVGHALESLLGYEGMSHGESVAAGMRVKIEIGRRMGLLTEAETRKVMTLMNRYGLCRAGINVDMDKLIEHMNYDKKNFQGAVNFVMLNGIGNPVINQGIDTGLLKDVLAEFLNG